jgi:hypothetical protein
MKHYPLVAEEYKEKGRRFEEKDIVPSWSECVIQGNKE